MKKIYLLLLLLATIFVACKKDKDIEFTTFTIEKETFVPTYNSVELSCELKCVATINEFYVQYDTHSDFSTCKEKQLVTNEQGVIYSGKIDGLEANTRYYVRYVAENRYSSVTSEKISQFQTWSVSVPEVEIEKIEQVLDTLATIRIALKFDGGKEVTAIGACWAIESEPTLYNYDGRVDAEDGQVVLDLKGLQPNTSYYVCAYAVNAVGVGYSESEQFVTLSVSDNPSDFQYESVDLGLSVKWATFNVGATKPEEYGDYFAWGEVEPKDDYSWNTYIYYDGSNLIKYTSNDSKIVLDPEDDAATMNWGGTWRMPTKAEQDELSTKCTWDRTTQNGVDGYKVTGPNGNSIFLPAAGYMFGGTLNGAGSNGYYWSGSLGTDDPSRAYYLYFYLGNVRWGSSADRLDGQSVRPVQDLNEVEKTYTISVSVNNSYYGSVSGGGDYEEGTQVTLTAKANLGYKFVEWSDGNRDNPRVIIVEGDATYEARFEKFDPEYVDLGLPSGILWATCNVGADSPEGYGDYFAWGEVEPKTTYNWDTYIYYDGSNVTKYTNSDGKTVLDPEDDAATVYWGSGWRTPTLAEQNELRSNCTWIWTMKNGVYGYDVVGTNGNSIFLPATGYMSEAVLSSANSHGYYWSSSLYGNNVNFVYYLTFRSGYVDWNYDSRKYGRTIRPVWGEGITHTPNRYTISVSVNSSFYGYVSGGGDYEEGTQVTLTATAYSGYKFVEWSDGNRDNPRVITVEGDATYEARFEEFAPEYVDLGLPSGLKWATCNVGADSPEGYGDYFAWGEVESKSGSYEWDTYMFTYVFTKYNASDNKTILDPEDDAASVNWGGNWRMPTKEEFDELIDKCDWVSTTQNGVVGKKITGPNGNSIFLPIAGYRWYEQNDLIGSCGTYWSSTLSVVWSSGLNANYYGHAYCVAFYYYSEDVEMLSENYYRYSGLPVRAVWGERSASTPKEYTISVSANNSSYGYVSGGGVYEEGTEVTLTATAYSGYKFVEWSDGETNNSRIITVTQDESYTAYFEQVYLNEGHEYVDLGLPSGLKWATCNVGATIPEEYGDYFAWGEVQSKTTYSWRTYQHCVDNYDNLTKYCTDRDYAMGGYTDDKTVLDPEDDAATMNWGGTWRMPTTAEQQELIDNCKWNWTTQNGVNGYKVVGPNGNSIFLSAAGYINEGTLDNAGSYGYYWSSSLNTDGPNGAYFVYVDSDYVRCLYIGRYYGLSVRPVCQ